jgi:hypothetical protein
MRRELARRFSHGGRSGSANGRPPPRTGLRHATDHAGRRRGVVDVIVSPTRRARTRHRRVTYRFGASPRAGRRTGSALICAGVGAVPIP